MFRNYHKVHIWLPGLFIIAAMVVSLLGFVTNTVKENYQSNEGLLFHTQWNTVTVISPKEGYRINYYCLVGENKLAIENVIKIIPEDDTVFTANGNYRISDNCIRQIIKDKQ